MTKRQRTLIRLVLVTAILIAAATVFAEDLTMGSRGSRVRDAQDRLTELGYDPGPADGIFGNGTRRAVRSFQIEYDLPVTGVIDDRTWDALTTAATAADFEDEGFDEFADFEDFGSFDDWGSSGHEFSGHLRTVYAARAKDSTGRFPFFFVDYTTGDGDVIYQGKDLDKVSMQQSELRLAWKGTYDNDLSSNVQVDVMQIGGPEHPFEDKTEIELDEAYVSYAGDRHSFTAGKVKVVWGVSDVFSPFNVLSSADMVDPFVNTGVTDVRGQWQLAWNYEEQGRFRLETILIPMWNSSLIPSAEAVGWEYEVKSDYWVPPLFTQMPSMVIWDLPIDDGWGNITYTDVYIDHVFRGVSAPKKRLDSASFGSRLSTSRGAWDLAGYLYTGLDPKPSPVIEATFFDQAYEVDGTFYNLVGYTAEMTMKYPRILIVGQSAETVIGKVRFKQEAAATYGRKSYPDLTTQAGVDRLLTKVTNNQDDYQSATEEGDDYTAISLVLGADYTFTRWDLITSAQLKITTRPGWDETNFGEKTTREFTFYAQRAYKDDQWTLSMGGLVEMGTGAALVSTRLKYAPMYHDYLEFSGGINLFTGPEPDESLGFTPYQSVLSSYRDFSHVFVSGRILFGI